MRETRINKNTDAALLLMGSRLRAEQTVDQLAKAMGVTPEQVYANESDAALLGKITVGELVQTLEATGSKVMVRQDGEVDEDQELEQVPQLPAWEPGKRRIIAMRTLADAPHALRKARLLAGLTQIEASARLGLSPASGNISKHEAGMPVSLFSMFRYATLYGCEFVVGQPPEED